VQQWNLAIQQDLPYSFSDQHLLPGLQGHPPGPAVPAMGHAAQRPPGALSTGYVYETYGGNSIYHAGAIQLCGASAAA